MKAEAARRAPRAAPHRVEIAERSLPGAAVPRAEIGEWRERFGLVAGITERGSGEPFSLALRSTEESAAVITERFRAFRAAMRPGFSALHMSHQCHGVRVLWHDVIQTGFHLSDEADGHATVQGALLLAVSVADCVPVYLAAKGGSAFALLHAGWRGTAAGMVEAGIEVLRRHSGARAAELSVHCGVAICGDCYEVGAEVAQAVERRGAGGATRLDLRAAIARRAESAGVRDISISPLCTSCHRDRFFSHRASGGAGGRQLAYLGRPRS